MNPKLRWIILIQYFREYTNYRKVNVLSGYNFVQNYYIQDALVWFDLAY
uniref:Uncharacterized protein n=1 Tax=Meloidogyne enterolobii TaxID=390850 RepID=A0A6V7TI84_MELEN|nr:unnamed protein product [Meloidogyne enterolobii]